MKASERLAPKVPLAFGMVRWGPLPGTEDMWIFWGGPGDHLELYARDPGASTLPGKRITHSAAGGTYDTTDQAEAAVMAFIKAGQEQE